jgi:predicted permease
LLQFRLAGVDKDDATRAKLKQLNDQLTEQQSTFDRNISDGQKVVRVSGRAALDGLPQDYIDRHKPAGDGTIQITTDYPDMLPALKFVKSDALRRQLFEAFDTRAYPKNRDVLKQMWTRNALVVCQVSLAFVLLIGSGLLTLSFMRLLAVDPGFQAQNVQTAQFSLPWARYKEDAQVRNFVGGLLERVRAIPGVTAAGATDAPPFTDRNNASAMAVEGYNPASGELPPVPRWSTIDAGYLAAMKIPLRAGRYFREGDTEATQKVVIIDEFLARKYWPEGKAVGGHIHRGIESKDAVATVIGIVGSVKSEDMADLSQRGEVYWNYKQQTQHTMHVVVKTAANDMQAVSAVRAALKQADPELPLFDVKTMPERVTHSVRDRKSAMVICMAFALLALTLSAIGIYGVLAYTVTQRTREFGIRMALGASAGDVVGMVVRHGLRLAAIGLGIGVAGALAITRLMTTMLYGVRPTDPLVFGSVAASLMAVAVAASVVPSLRISHIRPANALRYE